MNGAERQWWFSCTKFTCLVVSDRDNLITNQSAPIVRRFSGQPIKTLADWMRKLGGFKFKELTSMANSGCFLCNEN